MICADCSADYDSRAGGEACDGPTHHAREGRHDWRALAPVWLIGTDRREATADDYCAHGRLVCDACDER